MTASLPLHCLLKNYFFGCREFAKMELLLPHEWVWAWECQFPFVSAAVAAVLCEETSKKNNCQQ